MIKFTFLIPVYNPGKYFNNCLDTIKQQTYTNWECIILDDCSTDGSYELALTYASIDNRFIVHRNETNVKFVANNRNKLLNLIQHNTDYIIFIDHDDFINITLCDSLVNILQHNEYDMIQWNHYVSNPKCDLSNEETFIKLEDHANTKGEYSVTNPPVQIWVWDKAIKYSIIKKNNIKFFDNCFAEDSSFLMILYNYIHTIYCTGTYEYYHRILSNSLGRTNKLVKLPLSILCYAKLLVYFKQHKLNIGLNTVKRRYNAYINNLNKLLDI